MAGSRAADYGRKEKSMSSKRVKSVVFRGLMAVLLVLLFISLLTHRVFHPAR